MAESRVVWWELVFHRWSPRESVRWKQTSCHLEMKQQLLRKSDRGRQRRDAHFRYESWVLQESGIKQQRRIQSIGGTQHWIFSFCTLSGGVFILSQMRMQSDTAALAFACSNAPKEQYLTHRFFSERIGLHFKRFYLFNQEKLPEEYRQLPALKTQGGEFYLSYSIIRMRRCHRRQPRLSS